MAKFKACSNITSSMEGKSNNRGPRKPRHVHGTTLLGAAYDPAKDPNLKAGLRREFTFPPFSVLSAREGDWQNRKRNWLKLGIESELGRGQDGSKSDLTQFGASDSDHRLKRFQQAGKMSPGGSHRPACDYREGQRGDGAGKAIPKPPGPIMFERAGGRSKLDEASRKILAAGPIGADGEASGVSIFDPVLCELFYSWFCPPGGHVLDPFAGGSVRGVVASVLGRRYTGIDLSGRQVAANRAQGLKICEDEWMPKWLEGDSRRVLKTLPEASFDMVWSCPPYADLEVYSDAPDDISNMPYLAFLAAYQKIIRLACNRLKPDRFAAWVVGEVRDPGSRAGAYYGLVPDTIAAFRAAGLEYYNEAILLTAVGSLPVRTRRAFLAGRKMGKTHQNILVFVKGDPKKAAAAINPNNKTIEPENDE